MSPMKRYAKKQAKATKRRRLKAREQLRPQRANAQPYIEAIHQALEDLGFPATLVAEIEGRLQAQQQLLGKIVGMMVPSLCRTLDIWNQKVYHVTSLRDSISRTAVPFIGLKVEDRRDLVLAVEEHLAVRPVLPEHCDTVPIVPRF